MAIRCLIVVIPEEGVLDHLLVVRRCCEGRWIIELCLTGVNRAADSSHICVFTQPVLMAYLRVAVGCCCTATVEVGNLTLRVGGHQLGHEGQADGFPSCLYVVVAVSLLLAHIVVGLTLVPHTIAAAHGVGDRTVEVLLVYKQMVVGGGVGSSCQLYPVACDARGALCAYGAIGIVSLRVGRVVLVVLDDCCRLSSGRTAGHCVGIDEEVAGQVDVLEC